MAEQNQPIVVRPWMSLLLVLGVAPFLFIYGFDLIGDKLAENFGAGAKYYGRGITVLLIAVFYVCAIVLFCRRRRTRQ